MCYWIWSPLRLCNAGYLCPGFGHLSSLTGTVIEIYDVLIQSAHACVLLVMLLPSLLYLIWTEKP